MGVRLPRPLTNTAEREQDERLRVLESTRRVWPMHHIPWRPGDDMAGGIAVGVVSGSFVGCYYSVVPYCYGPCVDMAFYAYLPAPGVDGEVRVTLTDDDGSVSTAVRTLTEDPFNPGGTFHTLSAQWIHGRKMWGGPFSITFEARRTATDGMGNPVYLYAPDRVALRDPEGGSTTAALSESWYLL